MSLFMPCRILLALLVLVTAAAAEPTRLGALLRAYLGENTKIVQLDMDNTLIGVNRSPEAAIVGNLGVAFVF